MDNEAPTFVNQEEKEFTSFYKRSLFWIKIRPIAKRVGIAALIVFDVVMLSVATYRFIDYAVFDFFKDRAMIGSIVEGVSHFHAVSEARAAAGLKSSDAEVFTLDDGRADFYAELTNPNLDWEASFSYSFTYGETTTPEIKGFILPGEKAKPLAALAIKTGSTPTSAKLSISNLVWTRVNHHAIQNYATWASDRLNFEFTDLAFERNIEVSGTTIGRTSFTGTNASAFSFWSPTFTIVLMRNQKVVGVTATTLNEFAAGETRSVEVNWFGDVPQANETLIVPNIDIFDPAVYMPLHGEAQPDVRERIIKKR